jgi:transcriptional regulator with XRE-family HTH domain
MHPLRSYLKSRGITQRDLARLSGVSQVTISKVITGKRNGFAAKDAIRISKAIHNRIPIVDLFCAPEKRASYAEKAKADADRRTPP